VDVTVLKRLGLDRPELRAWALYDWANSSFVTTVITAIFPVYFTAVAASGLAPGQATRVLASSTTVALAISAILAPLLGAIADYAPVKKRLLGFFMVVGAASAAGLFWIRDGDWLAAAILFGAGNIGFAASLTFYDSLLPHIASEDEIDRVSTAGYAVGYLGGGLLLALNVAWIIAPRMFGLSGPAAGSRLSFLSVAIWWPLFSIPLFRSVREPMVGTTGRSDTLTELIAKSFRGLGHTLRELRRYKQALLLLVAYVIYSDGINTIIRMATSYGTEIGLKQSSLITAILLVQFVGIPFSFLFGMLAHWIGAKTAVFLSLAMYALITLMGYYMKTERDFFVLAIMVASVQGGSQALSRSLFASMIPRDRSSEFFGFFSVFEKFGAIAGPALFGLTSAATGSSRSAILSVLGFFVLGGLVLAMVDVKQGQRAALG
jgi:MFS transporter, UMF1 family